MGYLYRKSLSLRKTKTDKVDSRTIATMMMSDMNLKSYSDTSYHNEQLKSLTRYRFDKVKEQAKLKSSVSRLVCILFPELEKLVPTLHIASVYALLSEFPSADAVANAHLTRLSNLLSKSSKGRYGKDTAGFPPSSFQAKMLAWIRLFFQISSKRASRFVLATANIFFNCSS